jgi:hypothetical protein
MNLLLALLTFVVANGIVIAARRRRVQQLEAEIGPGRGNVQRAQPERVRVVDWFGEWSALPQRACDRSFLTNTRFTRKNFMDLLAELRPAIEANRRVRLHVPEPSGEPRATRMSTENRLIMTLKFLAHGTSNDVLATDFSVSASTVSEDLRHIVWAMASSLSYEIVFPDAERRARLSALIGPQFINAFGTFDDTFTPVFEHVGPAGSDFSGFRNMPVRSHGLAADALGFLIDVVAGQVGSRHDSFNYKRSTLADVLRACGSRLLADSGFEGCGDELITPAAAERLADPAERDLYKELHTSRRSRIEQFIGVLKALFKVVAHKWERHDRQFLSVCVLVSCMLYNRVRRLRA